MKLLKYAALASLLATASAFALPPSDAQPIPTQPPGEMYSPDNPKVRSPSAMLKITELVPKPGLFAPFRKLEIERAQALRKAKWPRTSMTITSMTGPKQLWTFTCYDRLAAIAEDEKFIQSNSELSQEFERIDAAEAPLLKSARDVTVSYKPTISYRPKFDWSQVGYWDILWIQTNQGFQGEYMDNRIMTREEHDNGAFDTHQMMYQIQSGQRAGTFFVMRPMKTFALMDSLHDAGDGEPLSWSDKKMKIDLFRVSSQREEEGYFRVEPEMTFLP